MPLYPSYARTINKLRKTLVKKIWNSSITESYKQKDIQYETLWQGFRMVGTRTKEGLKNGTDSVCRGFQFDKEPKYWTLEELFSYCREEDIERIRQIETKPKWTLNEMRERYGEEWVKKHYTPRGKWKGIEPKYWTVNKAFYESFKAKIYNETEEGHRYHALTMLCSVGWKCGVSKQEIEQDCFNLKKHFDGIEHKEPLNTEDVYDALKYLRKGNELHKFKNEYLTENAGVSPYEKRKRNGRKLKDHINIVNGLRQLRVSMGEDEYKNSGRPNKEIVVKIWQERHPNGTKYQCMKDTKLDKKTIRKWWRKDYE